jgi:RNA binding exosome subunit
MAVTVIIHSDEDHDNLWNALQFFTVPEDDEDEFEHEADEDGWLYFDEDGEPIQASEVDDEDKDVPVVEIDADGNFVE